MRWSYRVGRIAGIDVNIHVTFVLLIGFLVLAHGFSGHTVSAVADGVLFVMAIFTCVLLHELGHALAARRYGIATRDIILLPIGGVARLERIPEKPVQELLVALAGPAVNLVIALALYSWLVLANQLVPFNQLGLATGPFVERLLFANVILIAFNMLPAFPMDGGRCVRALLAMRIDYVRATSIAAGIGKVMAAGFMILGIFVDPFLILVGVFVWFGASQESRYAALKNVLQDVPVQRALISQVPVVSPSDSLERAAECLGSTPLHRAVVARNETVLGTISLMEVAEKMRRSGPWAPVSAAMTGEVQVIELPATLDEALSRLQEACTSVIPVVADGKLVGVVTFEQLSRFVAVRSAIQGYVDRAGGGGGRLIPKARPILAVE